MSLMSELDQRLKTALKAKDSRTASVLRMVKSRITERTKEAGFSGEVDDAMVTEVIAAYVKQMAKAIEEYGKAGDRGAAEAAKLQFEVDYLTPLLPQKLDKDATRPLVKAELEAAGVTDARQGGRVIGMVMKKHGDTVDPKLVRELIAELLA